MRDTMEIELRPVVIRHGQEGDGRPFRDRFPSTCDGGHDLKVQGNIVDHEYTIERDGDKMAEVSKQWFRVRDTYGIEVSPGQDDVRLPAVAVCIDRMTHD